MIDLSKKRGLLKSELIENLTMLETALDTLRYSYPKGIEDYFLFTTGITREFY